jgi:hypothetical protein
MFTATVHKLDIYNGAVEETTTDAIVVVVNGADETLVVEGVPADSGSVATTVVVVVVDDKVGVDGIGSRVTGVSIDDIVMIVLSTKSAGNAR